MLDIGPVIWHPVSGLHADGEIAFHRINVYILQEDSWQTQTKPFDLLSWEIRNLDSLHTGRQIRIQTIPCADF
jgi:hypothetical protein